MTTTASTTVHPIAQDPAGRPIRQVHLAAHFPGVNNTSVWSDGKAESQIAFSSFRHFAQNAERGKFDFLFLAEGLRLREQKGLIHDLDVVGRPNTLAILAGIAAVTEHIGLVGTLSSTFNEPYELARQLASLDLLSGGGPAGTSSRPPTPSTARTSVAAASSTRRTATCAPRSSSPSRAHCGMAGRPGPSPRTRTRGVPLRRCAHGGRPPRPAVRREGLRYPPAQPTGPPGDRAGRRLCRRP
ncbi:LLM class flavin-dependent oxidoreductase [Cryobacterium sp. 10C3]|uniref:LLM class flavin-dependent oxidoreductase n=1 Tax=Cryobacterium sp. 10C3 TaxID=3048577 RepID=UPI003A0FD9AA